MCLCASVHACVHVCMHACVCVHVFCLHVHTLCTYMSGLCLCVCPCVGADWLKACQEKCSPHHIVPSTGMDLTLQRSILKKDAFLPRYSAVLHRTVLCIRDINPYSTLVYHFLVYVICLD